MSKEKTNCRICKNKKLENVIDFGKQHVSHFTKSIKLSKLVDKDDLKLGICKACKTVQLFNTYSQKKMYKKYWYISGINEIMIKELSSIVDNAREYVQLEKDDYVLDIASNDGTLLENYPKYVNCLGVDPSDVARKSKKYKKNIKLINNFFKQNTFDKNFKKKFKIITIIAMFYDSNDPVNFLKGVNDILMDGGIGILQISYTPLMLKLNEFGVISHEHIFYYTFETLKKVMEKCGLKIIDVKLNDSNGSSIRVIFSKDSKNLNLFFPTNKIWIGKQNIQSMLNYETQNKFNEIKYYKMFSNNIKKLKNKTIKWLNEQKKNSKIVIGYGASTKGNVLLQYYNINSDLVKFIAERSIGKFGLYTPGSSIKIISEEKARRLNPDYLLILPWFFLRSFINREKKLLKNGTKFIIPQPNLTEVSLNSKNKIIYKLI
jgi:hypothetical protein